MECKIRVLTVDDSAYARFAITRQLQSDPEMEVIGFARDGVEAVAKIQALKPDVVTLDVEMPRMDGLSALSQIMSICPTPVVMLSTLTGEGMEATIKALELGAIDFFLKTSLTRPVGGDELGSDLRTKVRIAAKAKVSELQSRFERKQVCLEANGPRVTKPHPAGKAVVIGSSTGGPRALYEVVPALPADISAAILVVQHMPPGFTRSLAERLSQVSEVEVKEAEANAKLRQGQALVAPGGYHMVVTKDRIIGLNENLPECGVRPAVNVTMESVAMVFGASSFGVVLTGMGSDGTRGTSLIKAAGGKVVAQDRSTCAIYGMPKSVVDAGYADRVVPLSQVVPELIRMLDTERSASNHG